MQASDDTQEVFRGNDEGTFWEWDFQNITIDKDVYKRQIPISLLSMVIMYSVGMKRMGPYYQSAQKMNNTIIEYINGMEAVSYTHLDVYKRQV